MKQLIKSPFQITKNKENLAKDIVIARMMSDLLRVHNQFLSKIKEFDEIIKNKVGPKGDKGDLPEESRVVELIRALIPEPIKGEPGIQGEPGKTPEKFVDYYTPQEVKEIVEFIQSKIKVENGKTPKKGVDYFTVSEKREFIKELKSYLKTTEKKDKLPVSDVLEEIKGKLKSADIVDLDEKLEALKRKIDSSSAWRGGGDTVIAGTNITITVDSNGNKVISSTGGSGLSLLTPTGAVNGINDTFVFTSAPTLICVDQGRFMQQISSSGFVNWTGTTTVTLLTAPTFDIFGL